MAKSSEHPAVEKYLDLNTRHLPEPFPDWGNYRRVLHHDRFTGEMGVILFVGGVADFPDLIEEAPAWMRPILLIAAAEGASLLVFDCDAPVYEDLPTWDW